ncbi:MAG: hypothetical protein ABJP70_06015 [Erythrobacter sp.]
MFRMFTLFFAGLIAGALAFPTPTFAQSGSPDGYVERTRGGSGQVTIVRNGRQIAAKANTRLYAGDKIRVTSANAYATVLYSGQKGRVRITSRKSPFTIPKAKKPTWGDRFSNLVRNVGGALGFTDRSSGRSAFTRSGRADDGEQQTAQPLSRLSHFDTSVLLASRELDVFAIRWCGDAARVELIKSNGLPILGATGQDEAFGAWEATNFIEREGDVERLPTRVRVRKLASGTQDLNYALEWISLDNVPRPAALEDKAELSAADRLEWGVWLLANEDGKIGNSFSLIAFSLMAQAKEQEDLWVAAHAMDLASYCPENVDLTVEKESNTPDAFVR